MQTSRGNFQWFNRLPARKVKSSARFAVRVWRPNGGIRLRQKGKLFRYVTKLLTKRGYRIIIGPVSNGFFDLSWER